MDREQRILTTQIELRNNDDSDYIEGYALKFEKWSERLGGWFKEIISQTALDNARMDNVVALFNHRDDYVLARNNNTQSEYGRLELTVDNIGLRFKFKPTNTSYAKDLMENIRAGVIDKCSFAFNIDYDDENADEWDYDEDERIYKRRINKFNEIYDISIVTTPAYSDTEAVIGKRSKAKVDEIEKQKAEEVRARKLLERLEQI